MSDKKKTCYTVHVSYVVEIIKDGEDEAVADAAFGIRYGCRGTRKLSISVMTSEEVKEVEETAQVEAVPIAPPDPLLIDDSDVPF